LLRWSRTAKAVARWRGCSISHPPLPFAGSSTTGSVEAKPGTGHSRSPLQAHAAWLLDLVAQTPDLTLEEIRDRLKREKKLEVAVSSVWRFYDRHAITFKKSPPRSRAGSP
jgi:transposase